MNPFIEKICQHQVEILRWLEGHEDSKEVPLYSSVDIRDADFKIAVVDTNLFPAGFNNLCEHGLEDAVKFIRQAILDRVTPCRDILLVVEEHTRNTWYLESIRILQEIIEKAGFTVKIATFLSVEPEFCQEVNFIELITATNQPVRIYCFKHILDEIKAGRQRYDLIILNNDLMAGIPSVLEETDIPIYPSLQAGWHSRLKSYHFKHTADLVSELAKIIKIDPWFFSCLDAVADGINVNVDQDRTRLTDLASDLFKRITAKYKEHKIASKPFIFVKADAGSYGMGVMAIEDPKEIQGLNRKARNKLYKGKGAQVIARYLLQEGVPTIYNIDQQVSEVVIYQIANNFIGGFYRSNSQKSDRENLNSQGMDFKKMCPHLKKYGDCGVHHDVNIFDLYRILARLAGIAAHREILELEASKK